MSNKTQNSQSFQKISVRLSKDEVATLDSLRKRGESSSDLIRRIIQDVAADVGLGQRLDHVEAALQALQRQTVQVATDTRVWQRAYYRHAIRVIARFLGIRIISKRRGKSGRGSGTTNSPSSDKARNPRSEPHNNNQRILITANETHSLTRKQILERVNSMSPEERSERLNKWRENRRAKGSEGDILAAKGYIQRPKRLPGLK